MLSIGPRDEILNIDGLLDEQIAGKIKDFLKRTKTARQWWLPVVPTREALLRAVTVPSCDEKEAHKMIRWQLQGRWGDEKDLVTDYVLAPCSRTGTKALIGVMDQAVLTRYWNILRAAGVLLDGWSVGCLMVQNSVEDKGDTLWCPLSPIENGNYGLLYFDDERCDLCVFMDRWPVLSRSFVIDDKDSISDVDSFLSQQINISLQACQEEHKIEIPRIVLLGPKEDAGVLKRSLEKRMLALSCPFDFCAGVAQREEPLMFRWIPSVIKEEKIKEFRLRQWAVFAVLSALFVSLALSFVGIRYYKEMAYARQARREEEALRQQVQELQQMKQQLNAIAQRSGRRIMVSDLWGKLDALRPPSLYLTRLEWHAKGGMVVQGAAASEADINEWQKRLVASHLFDDVVLQSAQRQREGNGENVYFKIRCTSVGEADH